MSAHEFEWAVLKALGLLIVLTVIVTKLMRDWRADWKGDEMLEKEKRWLKGEADGSR